MALHEPAAAGLRLRAGDRDRDAAVERLRAAYAEGRLQEPELDERLGAALVARTVGELNELTADLPAAQAPLVRTPPSRPGAATDRQVALRGAWGTWVLAVGINVVIWLAVVLGTGSVVYFWPVWVAGPWGAILLMSTLTGGRGVHGRSPERSCR